MTRRVGREGLHARVRPGERLKQQHTRARQKCAAQKDSADLERPAAPTPTTTTIATTRTVSPNPAGIRPMQPKGIRVDVP
jgi:hypothetical protein